MKDSFLFDLENSLAGTPATVTFGGTSFVTTELAPILALSPTFIDPKIWAPEPIITLLPIVGCLFWFLWVSLSIDGIMPPKVTPW